MQSYQQLIQEDLNIGTGEAWVTAPGGGELRSTQIGLHSVARQQRSYTATWAPGAIPSGGKTSTTVTVPNAVAGDFVVASHDKILTSDLLILGHVSAADTVKVVIHNPTNASVTVASGTVKVAVFEAGERSTDPVTGSVSGTIYVGTEAPGNELSGATVSITAQSLTTTSGVDGTYSFATVTPGAVTVLATKVACVANSESGTVTAGNNTVINVTIACPI